MPIKNESIDKKVTHATMVSDCRTLKDEKFRVRITVGGCMLPHHLDSGSPEAYLLETKLILNSVTQILVKVLDACPSMLKIVFWTHM